MQRILLTEGTTTSARQTIFALAPLRPVIDVCDSQPLSSLAFASFQVRGRFRCPAFNRDPEAFIRFVLQRVRNFRYDVLLPTHDEIYAVAAFRERFARYVNLAIPEFEALRLLQSKASFVRLLTELRLPFPPTVVGRTQHELKPSWDGPCFVKLAHGTAGCGVWFAENEQALRLHLDWLEHENLLDGRREILVQQQAPGTLCVAQAVFQLGRFVAWHGYQARALGVGGSPRARIGVFHPLVKTHVEKLGNHLRWHGAMFIDYLFDERTGKPAYIDANPRIGETLNATLSGMNLANVLVKVAGGEQIAGCAVGKAGICTHSALTSILHAALQSGSRTKVIAEIVNAVLNRGLYSRSSEELTRLREDPPSILPLLVLCLRLFCNPRIGEGLVRRSVAKYGLDEEAVTRIMSLRQRLR